MKLIVGLGNPGKEYENTRHNVGFLVVDNYVKINNLTSKSKFNGIYYETTINKEKMILLKPQSFMNLSGMVVKKYADYFKINLNDILIIYDDMDFELGTYKIKKTGSSAGHNGINNIIEYFKTEEINRMRIGISKKIGEKADYVIGEFSKGERSQINEVIKETPSIIEDFTKISMEELMAKYN